MIHNKVDLALTAEQLMRARYSAFAYHLVDFLYDTVHPRTRRLHQKKEILSWSMANRWLKLEILHSKLETVEFKAYYLDAHFRETIHHERSTFKQLNGIWYYVDGKFLS
ncbi:YchJ family protein [Sphingobacterium sp. LRF_L2]|uniref:YchJ family protein n=1 Tax=Sphingobacterium sp. LRF_L2 TaxID=3369421 RepID=UPI003F628941